MIYEKRSLRHWRIRYFPGEGRCQLQTWVTSYYLTNFFPENCIKTRKHSSRMHTAQLPTVCVILASHVRGDGLPAPGTYLPLLDIPTSWTYPNPWKGPGTRNTHQASERTWHHRYPPLPVDRMTDTCEKLPSSNFVGGQ